ncbi:GntR family transcriptional regulator [Babesia caballi]|uniref:GntR family transcriptional regulator n=1 Tax=Babesia caballi TaxID=5871 RepID=A0AAV4LPM2_BABCB|nr:GntR family transcriptional regulator [Babesia caballi]
MTQLSVKLLVNRFDDVPVAKEIEVSAGDTVAAIKERHFAEDVQNGRSTRLCVYLCRPQNPHHPRREPAPRQRRAQRPPGLPGRGAAGADCLCHAAGHAHPGCRRSRSRQRLLEVEHFRVDLGGGYALVLQVKVSGLVPQVPCASALRCDVLLREDDSDALHQGRALEAVGLTRRLGERPQEGAQPRMRNLLRAPSHLREFRTACA